MLDDVFLMVLPKSALKDERTKVYKQRALRVSACHNDTDSFTDR